MFSTGKKGTFELWQERDRDEGVASESSTPALPELPRSSLREGPRNILATLSLTMASPSATSFEDLLCAGHHVTSKVP